MPTSFRGSLRAPADDGIDTDLLAVVRLELPPKSFLELQPPVAQSLG